MNIRWIICGSAAWKPDWTPAESFGARFPTHFQRRPREQGRACESPKQCGTPLVWRQTRRELLRAGASGGHDHNCLTLLAPSEGALSHLHQWAYKSSAGPLGVASCNSLLTSRPSVCGIRPLWASTGEPGQAATCTVGHAEVVWIRSVPVSYTSSVNVHTDWRLLSSAN